MLNLDCQANIKMKTETNMEMVSTDISSLRSPKSTQPSASPRPAGPAATAAYDHYLRLPELSKLWSCRQFPDWKGEPVVKPALQALEITFRFISITLSDSRPYANHREWARRLESLASRQLELVAAFCQEEQLCDGVPTCQLSTSRGVLTRDRSSQEVWKIPGSTPVVSRTSEESLLPRLAAWEKSEGIASKLLMEIECQMRRAPFTLGLGEPNLAGKPNLEYDLVCRPTDLHALFKKKKSDSGKQQPSDCDGSNHDGQEEENRTLCTSHQILEAWVFVAKQLLLRTGERIEAQHWEGAASDCWLLERVWKLLSEIEDLHLLMDPDDFLRLKHQLGIKATTGSDAFCFRSMALVEITRRSSNDLKRRVPEILGVEVDPEGGPRLQVAAMKLFSSHKRRSGREEAAASKIHLLQALQAVDAAVKKFFFAYRQLIVAVMGSLEAAGGGDHSLNLIFMEPPYFPSLDAAKTFLADFYQRGGSLLSGHQRSDYEWSPPLQQT